MTEHSITLTLSPIEAKALFDILPKTMRSNASESRRALFDVAVKLYAMHAHEVNVNAAVRSADVMAKSCESDSSHRDDAPPLGWSNV